MVGRGIFPVFGEVDAPTTGIFLRALRLRAIRLLLV